MEDLSLLVEEYIDSIQQDIETLEGLILAFESGAVEDDQRKKVLRIVHSLKGSSGSYGFRNISRRCHLFEDYFIKVTKEEGRKIDIDRLLRYVDDFKQFAESGKDIEPLEQEAPLPIVNETKSVLLVDSSSVDNKMISHALSQMDVSLTVEKDGLNAIDRVLTKKYEAIILSTTISGLDGISLLKTLRVIESVNKNTKIALLTTRSELDIEDHFKPDLHIIKDSSMKDNIFDYLKGLLGTTSGEFTYGHVVYIDDTKSLHTLMKMALKKQDCRVDCFEDSDAAIEFINEHKPDLILCDYNLNDGVTGADVYKGLKHVGKKFFFLTGEEASKDKELLEETPQVSGIIHKPISPKLLAKQIVDFK